MNSAKQTKDDNKSASSLSDTEQKDESEEEDEEPPVNVGDVVDNQFKIIQILGQGGFGAVFEVLDMRSNNTYALKIELQTPDPDEPGLKLEIGVLRRMQRNKHFPQFIHGGKFRGLTYLVMQLLGDNLLYLRKKCPGRRFTINTSIQLADQTFECVEAMHKSDLLHRDIKPENFVTGRTSVEKRIIYLLDFGMVRRFRIKGKVRPARPIAAFRGTLGYASPNVLSNQDAGRHDDIYSWLYVIIECVKGRLPWHSERTNRRRMLELKLKKVDDLLADLPVELKDIYFSLAKLQYADEPPCHAIRNSLNKIRHRERVKDKDPFDWEPGGAYYEDVFSKLEDKRRNLKLKKMPGNGPRSRCDDLTMKTFILDFD